MLRQQQGGGGGHGHARDGAVVIGIDVLLDGPRQLLGQEGLPLLWSLEEARIRLRDPVGVVGESAGLRDNDVDVLRVVEVNGIRKLQPIHVLFRAACTVEQVHGRAVFMLGADDGQRNLPAVHCRRGCLELFNARIVLVLLVPGLTLDFRGRLQRGNRGLCGIARHLLRGQLGRACHGGISQARANCSCREDRIETLHGASFL